MKRGRLLVSVGCVIQLPLRIIATVTTPEVVGAKESLLQLRERVFASDIHLAWLNRSDSTMTGTRVLDWLRHARWLNESTLDLDLVCIDCIHCLDSLLEVDELCRRLQVTHAIVDSTDWIPGLSNVPHQYLMLGQREEAFASLTWESIQRRILNE